MRWPVYALLALLALPVGASQVDEWVADGDAWWARRAEGHSAETPAREPIAHAISAYEQAVARAPEDLTARWKLLRALYFLGEYATPDPEAKLAVFERGRTLAETGLDVLARQVGGREALDSMADDELRAAVADRGLAAETYFWAAAHWGLWGRTRGKLAAAREGVAGTVRDYAERVIALDETIENAGGHRILGRLHSEAPRIPFFTGWIDHDEAVEELERTLALAPGDLLTRVYHAEALLDHVPKRRDEAVAELRRVAASAPNPAFLVEDLHAVAQARERLRSLDD